VGSTSVEPGLAGPVSKSVRYRAVAGSARSGPAVWISWLRIVPVWAQPHRRGRAHRAPGDPSTPALGAGDRRDPAATAGRPHAQERAPPNKAAHSMTIPLVAWSDLAHARWAT
jgi:hypothetical protein